MKNNTHTISLGNRVIPCKVIKRKGHRSFTLSVHAGGKVTLTVPKRTTNMQVRSFIAVKKRWLIEHVTESPDARGLSSIDRNHYKRHKEAARVFVVNRLQELNAQYNFLYNRVSIRANTTRWGSCSYKKNLNFDYRILFLPASLQDYILVHELCHLRELNHSARFWNLVSEMIPSYKSHRKALREHVF